MTHAYNKMYLGDVIKNIAAVFDIGLNALEFDADEFSDIFSASSVATGIENAVPDMLTGKSATEMLSIILNKKVDFNTVPTDRTPEYWAGWILARAQWELNKSFEEILSAMPLSSLIAMYYPYHEADDEKTVDIIREHFSKKEPPLKTMRKLRKLTQEQLAMLSGVNVRSIRSYEQGDNDILKAQAETLQQLANTLDCSIEDLLP